MSFYQITSHHTGGRKYPWAAGYGPLEMEQMTPFLSGMPASFRDRKLGFWNIDPQPPGLEIDPGGTTWSDFIGCGSSPPSFFVSESVLRDLEENGIEILRKTEMPIAKINAKRLQKESPPKYYILEAIPGIARAWDLMGIQLDGDGQPVPNLMPSPRPEAIYRTSSWNGLDLCSFSDAPQTTCLICTDRVKELAETKGWTNVQFLLLKSTTS